MTTWRKSSRSDSGNEGGCVEVARVDTALAEDYARRMSGWRESSRSGSGQQGGCVEVASARGDVAVRDSKDPGGPQLHFTTTEWRSLLAEIKAG